MMGLLIAKLIIFEEQDKRTIEQNFENELISDKCQLSVGMNFFFAAYSLIISCFVSHFNAFFYSRRFLN